jgi:hypothetical protein
MAIYCMCAGCAGCPGDKWLYTVCVQGVLAVLVVDDSPEELWRVSSPTRDLLLSRKDQVTV